MDGGGHGKGQSGRDGVTKPKTRWEIKCDRADQTEKDLEEEKKKVSSRVGASLGSGSHKCSRALSI